MYEMSPQNDTSPNRQVRTFIFFDLETTGLIQGSSMPRITEISLVAATRSSLFTKNGALPRVMHKLTIPLQPLRFIPLNVSEITGLYNDLLEEEKPFDCSVYDMMNSFIGRLCSPVCFVAHNGHRFDYPILLSELNRIGKSLSEDILCIDSLDAFKTLFDCNNPRAPGYIGMHVTNDKDSKLLDDGCDAALASIVDIHSGFIQSADTECMDTAHAITETDMLKMQKTNETTPTHQINSTLNLKLRKQFKKDGLPVKKRLPFTRNRPANFKLDTLYEHLVGHRALNSHCAEGDCLSLLTCVQRFADSFVRWADLNASPLFQYGKQKK